MYRNIDVYWKADEEFRTQHHTTINNIANVMKNADKISYKDIYSVYKRAGLMENKTSSKNRQNSWSSYENKSWILANYYK